jgi:hypothetical protein
MLFKALTIYVLPRILNGFIAKQWGL